MSDEKYACHIDLEGQEPDNCVLDGGDPDACFYTRVHGQAGRQKCGEWKPIKVLQPSAAQRQWVGLTDEEIDRVTDTQWANNFNKPIYASHRAYARAIEAKLKEKNHG